MKPVDTQFTDSPVCPHCGAEDQEWWDQPRLRSLSVEIEDGSEWEINCPWCERDYKVTACIQTSFSTDPSNDSHFKAVHKRYMTMATDKWPVPLVKHVQEWCKQLGTCGQVVHDAVESYLKDNWQKYKLEKGKK